MAATYLIISLDSNLVEIWVQVNIVVKRMLRCTGCVNEVTEVSNQYVSKDWVSVNRILMTHTLIPDI